MAWNGNESRQALVDSVESGDLDDARELVDEYVAYMDEFAELGDEKVLKRVLTTLRDYTLFDELRQIGDRIKKYDQDQSYAHKLYCQAMIDLGDITVAIDELDSLKSTIKGSIARIGDSDAFADRKRRDDLKEELREVSGLLGRCYKQLYVNANPTRTEPRQYDLDRAVAYYEKPFREEPTENYWHGVNYMALKTHQERLLAGDPRKRSDEACQAAKVVLQILEEVEEKKNRTGDELGPWEFASRAESCLALGQNSKAIEAIEGYLDHPGIDRFMVQGTLRQFRELWQLTENTPPGRQILPRMVAKLAQLPGGRMEMEAGINLEAVFGDVSYQPIEWLRKGLERSRSVARLGRSLFDGSGTGWLFDGSWLSDDWAGKPLLMTNAHVCTSDDQVRSSLASLGLDVLRPDEAVVGFLGASTDPSHTEALKIEREVFTSPPSELDATLLLLDAVPDDIEQFPRADTLVAVDDRVNIIGHPHGKRLSVSLQDNKVVELDDNGRYLYYKTPTDPGSSGSPIFNQSWQIVGLHHASKKSKKANEGIHLAQIVDSIKGMLGIA